VRSKLNQPPKAGSGQDSLRPWDQEGQRDREIKRIRGIKALKQLGEMNRETKEDYMDGWTDGWINK
jgi:hypothetical protein